MHISVNSGVCDRSLSLDARYAQIAKAGFTAVDWMLGGGANTRTPDYEGKCIFEKPLEEVIAFYADELSAIRKNNLFITQAHAPQPAYLAGYPEVTDYCIRIYGRLIEFCEYIGCPRLVIHGIDYKFDNTVDPPEEIDRLNRHLFESLIPTMLRCNVMVCMENLYVRKYRTSNDDVFIEGPAADPTATAQLIDALNEKAGKEIFGLCLDTGHMHIVRKDARTYIPILGKRIKALHLNDNNCSSDDHLVPLSGNAEWDSICKALRNVGYSGDINFEIGGNFTKIRSFSPELILPWLELTYKTGLIFQKLIQG